MRLCSVAVYVRLQLQNMKDESRGTTHTCTARSNGRSLRSGRARVVKVREFSSQIPLPKTTGREEWQRRGTIRNIFEVRTKAFLKSTSCFLRADDIQKGSHYFHAVSCPLSHDPPRGWGQGPCKVQGESRITSHLHHIATSGIA